MIDGFRNKHRFLSNFWPCDVAYDGVSYVSIEHAYQAAKTLNPAIREKIRMQSKAGKAKSIGKRIKLRPDWDAIKLSVMRDLVRQKFANGHLRQLLVNTGSEEIVESNTWGDTFWGVCDGEGQNWLGKILMEVRQSFRDANK